LPSPHHFTVHVDRSISADYRQLDIEQLFERRRQRVLLRRANEMYAMSSDEWVEDVKEVGQLVQLLRARGSEVVFVRFPTEAEHWEVDESQFPKSLYWDRIARLTGAMTLHFRDVEGLSLFRCPDTSHLDQRDTPEFTNILLDELVKMGALPAKDESESD
jgi:hypothetical protein